METERGFDPSYSWPSIWGVRSLLFDGLKWRVGNGSNIRVWEDAWLPGAGSHLVPTPRAAADLFLRVSDLICFEEGRWNVHLINSLFVADEGCAIRDIPLSQHWGRDELYWWPNKNGWYSVRSGYWVARRGYLRAWELQHDVEKIDKWKQVWRIDDPPKLRHFLWRARKGGLAVTERLKARHIITDATCPVCGGADESIIHAIFFRTNARIIWDSSTFQDTLAHAPLSSFAEIFEWMGSQVSKTDFMIFSSLCWAAWYTRNMTVFETTSPRPLEIARGMSKLVQDYVVYASRVFGASSTSLPSMATKWSPPAGGCVKLNVDAHVMADRGVGLGVVARNSTGMMVGMLVCRCSARWDAQMG